MVDAAGSPEGRPTAPTPPPSDGTVERIVAVVLFVALSLYLITLLADWYGFQFFAGKFSLGLFLAGSIWSVGFLVLRTANQAATESYDLSSMSLEATHPDLDVSSSAPVARVVQRYQALARRHEAITRVRSYSAILSLIGTAFAGIAAATLLVGITSFWAIFDFFAVLGLLGALVVYALGTDHLPVTHRLNGLLPTRWN